jgi:pimeloyl-ACP methyl ester carboxylesterase
MCATPTGKANPRPVGSRSEVRGLPDGLFVAEQPPARGSRPGRPVVVLVHGSLDRAGSFGRVARRLADLCVVSYDRRGYQGSRGLPVSDDLSVHVEDLLQVAAAYAGYEGAAGVVAVGHSVGATIVLGAAVSSPEAFRAAGAYEPSMPWLGFHRRDTPGAGIRREPSADPALEAERFFRRMVGDAAWERLPEDQREGRRADGPALLADLRAIRRGTPFDATALSVPTIVSSGGAASYPHHRDTADWLEAHVPRVRRSTIADAGHGAHLSHPDAFAALVREVVALGTGTSDEP